MVFLYSSVINVLTNYKLVRPLKLMLNSGTMYFNLGTCSMIAGAVVRGECDNVVTEAFTFSILND